MLNIPALAVILALAPNGVAPPDEFDPVTSEVSVDDYGSLEVLVFDADGFMDGAMLITPLPDHIRFDASFGDGDVSFKLVLFGDKAAVQLLDMGLPVHVAEARVNTMLEFADGAEDDGSQHITKRRCMIKFGTIAAVCAGAAALGVGGAVVPCAFYLVDSLCECLPLLGYDPCN
jgi:hypothetical protein